MNKMSTAPKRARTDGADESKTEVVTIAKAWDSLKASGPLYFKTLEEYLEDLEKTEGDITEIMGASFFKSAGLENRFVVPAEFKDFTVTRGDGGRITSLTDSNKDGIRGGALVKVLAYDSMKDKGMSKVIMTERGEGELEVLAIPKAVFVEDAPDLQSQKEYFKEARWLYTRKARVAIYTPRQHIVALLKLSYVTLSVITTATKTLNSVASKEDFSDFDAEKLADFDGIQSLLASQDVKQSKKNLFQTLLAAKISKLEIAERVKVFSGNATYRMAEQLTFRLPHGGPCYTKLQTRKLTPVSLSTLEPDASILMSTNVMSHKDYKDVKGDVAEYPVFVDAENLGGKKSNKWAVMSVKHTMNAQHVRDVLAAISASNGPVKSKSSSETPGDKDDSDTKFISLD